MSISLSPELWVRSSQPLPQARLRMFCLPYGGGDASLFHTWPQSLPTDMQESVEICPIQLPGRANRIREPLLSRLSVLVDLLVPADLSHSPLYPFLDRPFAFFGVSLGGVMSFEIARALSTRHQREAELLCIAASRAPHLPGPYGIDGAEHLGDEEIVKQIRALGGTPESILSDEKHLRLILPKIRADAQMAATYVYSPDVGLQCPITVCGGTDDGLAPLSELAAWQVHTTNTFRLYTFPGDHFFVRDASAVTRRQLLDYFARALRVKMFALPPTQPALHVQEATETA